MSKINIKPHGPCVLCGDKDEHKPGVIHPETSRFLCYECTVLANSLISMRTTELLCGLKIDVAALKPKEDGK